METKSKEYLEQGRGGLREGRSGLAQFFNEDGEGLIIRSISAMAHGDTHRLRGRCECYQTDTVRKKSRHLRCDDCYSQTRLDGSH